MKKTNLAVRILCGVLALIMVGGVAFTFIYSLFA